MNECRKGGARSRRREIHEVEDDLPAIYNRSSKDKPTNRSSLARVLHTHTSAHAYTFHLSQISMNFDDGTKFSTLRNHLS